MVVNLRFVLLLLALVVLTMAALNVNAGNRINLIGAGLALLVLSMLIV